MFALTVALFAAVASAQTYGGVQVIVAPTSANNINSQYPECTAVYKVTLSSQWTNQGNDVSMLPPMGINTTQWGGANYIGYPYPNDPVKQARAAALNSVTALTEPTGGFTTYNDAYPLGFQTDLLRYSYSVCVQVKNVYNRWVEVMAYAKDKPICVTDYNKPDLNSNPTSTSCGHGMIYTCRESGNPVTSTGSAVPTYADNLLLRFYCQGATCDSSDFAFQWRISAG